MPATVIIGGQWGDEGKGRVVDYAAKNSNIIARYSAGTNAGHTIVNDLGKFSLHLIPAGIFYSDKKGSNETEVEWKPNREVFFSRIERVPFQEQARIPTNYFRKL